LQFITILSPTAIGAARTLSLIGAMVPGGACFPAARPKSILMVNKADIAKAIEMHPKEAADALLAIQVGSSAPTTLDVYAVIANQFHQTTAQFVANSLEGGGLLLSYAQALKALGISVDSEELKPEDFVRDFTAMKAFLPSAEAFRCRVAVNGQLAGSGCLVGPSLVLTAWHVIAPDFKTPAERIEIWLSDEKRQPGRVLYSSTCSDLEAQGQFPTDDTTLNGHNDVVLIRLDRPYGIHLGYARLPKTCWKFKAQALVLLIHYPAGRDLKGYAEGRLREINGITARWGHDILTEGGSSGGPCFTPELELGGLHQGKLQPSRLVPIGQFIEDIRPLVDSDVAPPRMWSLDGTPDGALVIGRDLFFEAIAAASRPASRIRGVSVKRRNAQDVPTGLAFSFDMLNHVLSRDALPPRLVRLTFEPPYGKLITKITGWVNASKVPVQAVDALDALRIPDFVKALNAAAEREKLLYWFFFDAPAEGLAEVDHVLFESLVTTALQQPWLRVVLAGFETFLRPGEEFTAAGQADGDGPPGFVTEWIGFFNRGDVEALLRLACDDMDVKPAPEVIRDRANQALQGLKPFNGQYSTTDLEPLSNKLREQLRYFKSLRPDQ
jgi:Trypsin-like peptidase domain